MKIRMCLLICSWGAATANATTVFNSTITILGTSSSAFPGYGSVFALDTGANRFLTDFASNGLGNATHLDFDFGSFLTFDSIFFTDRTSSGGSNGSNVRGVSDFVVSYQFIFSTDPTFGDAGDTTVNVGPRTVPSAGAVLSAFQTTTSISNVTARYVRWQVVSAQGVNPGAADFQFDAVNPVPEPGTVFSVATGLAILALRRRRRDSSGWRPNWRHSYPSASAIPARQ